MDNTLNYKQHSLQKSLTSALLLYFVFSTDVVQSTTYVRPVAIPGLGFLNGFYNDSTLVTSFLGVPYAKPPVGNLRFQLPQIIHWNGTREAVTEPLGCIAASPESSTHSNLSEDCLYLNIYVPGNMTAQSANLSVMVWIHGGGFNNGIANPLDVQPLVSRGDTIVVTINYRLSVFGFLSSGDKVLPGNAGLHDQLMALKWIKKNIPPFGGDPERITLFGQSSGAVSIYILLASSSVTNGLFSRAIIQSGIIEQVTEPQNAFEMIAKLTSCQREHFNHSGESTRMQIKCMQNKTTEDFIKATRDQRAPIFGPVIDNVFLKYTVIKDLSTPRRGVPCLIGLNNNEYVLKTNERIQSLERLKKRLGSLKTPKFDPMSVQLMVTRFLTSGLEDAYTDAANSRILASIQNIASLISGRENVFMYYFTHHPSFSTSSKNSGARNSDELPFLFGSISDMPSTTPSEKILSRDIIDIWTSFAREGVPQLPNGVTWPPYEKTNRTYVELNINITANSVKQKLREGDRIFWNELMSKMMQMDSAHSHHTTMKSHNMKMHHTHHTGTSGSSKFAWGMSETAVKDLLMALLILAIFMTVICISLIIILCKVKTIKLQATRQYNASRNATVTGNINQAFANDPVKSVPESITAL